jgi:hypothetical protein
MRNSQPCAIVVDASIARSAGETEHPVSSMCREFLETMRNCHHVFAANRELLDEWERHRSRFSRSWLVSMVRSGRLKSLPEAANKELWSDFSGEDCPEHDYRRISKDLHLVDAALCTDKRVASGDDRVRCSLKTCLNQHPPVGDIAWVNPILAAETPLDWLRQGAPCEDCRLLKNYTPPPAPIIP